VVSPVFVGIGLLCRKSDDHEPAVADLLGRPLKLELHHFYRLDRYTRSWTAMAA